MHGFEYFVPTEIVFGAGSTEKLPELLKKRGLSRVLVVYGGSSAKKSGLLDRVFRLLDEAGVQYRALGGVQPNPRAALALAIGFLVAAFALGAEGIQMGTRFALSEESSASDAFKKLCIGLQEGDTMLALKKLSPTRLIRNDFFRAVEEAENRGATAEELQQLLGRGRSKRGIFEGDLTDGKLEIGQAASLIRELPTAGQIVRETVAEYEAGLQELVKQATNCKEEI